MADVIGGAGFAARAESGEDNRGASRLGQWSWALYEWARNPYFILVNIYIFAPYFTQHVIGDPVRGQALWGFGTTVVAIMIAVTAPLLGAIADAGGRRKPWLVFCTLVGAPAMAALWYAAPGLGEANIRPVFFALVVATLCFEWSVIFHNSMLPSVAPPERIGALSGLSLGLGNLGGIVLFIFFLGAWALAPQPLFGLDRAAFEPERAVGPLTGLWFLLFALPLFLFSPDGRSNGLSVGQSLVHGARRLAGTVRTLKRYRNVARYVVARMIYNDAFIITLALGGIYAAGLFTWDSRIMAVYGIVLSITAAIGAIIGGRLDDRLGSKRAIQICLIGYMSTNLIGVSMAPNRVFFMPYAVPEGHLPGLVNSLPETLFFVNAMFSAIFITAGLATSRTMLARLAPRSMMTEFFGLYALSGTATAFLGPAAVGLLTELFASQRAGFAAILFFVLTGYILLRGVREERAPEPDPSVDHTR